MNIEEALQMVALQTRIDPEALIQAAAEDSIGGWDLGKGGWPIGSLWSVEGKTLFALVRALQPEKVVEIGTHRGCSATHIATALDINGKGELVTVDAADGTGDLIPENLSERVSRIAADGVAWLTEQPDESIDIIYEDADHSAETCAAVAELAQHKLRPGGLLVVHDAAHDFAWLGDGSRIYSDVGETIRRGLSQSLGSDYKVYHIDPSDCGFALYQRPVTAQAKQTGLSGDDGYTRVPGETDGPAIEQVSEKMTKADLISYAESNDIDLTGADTKADILAKIGEAQAAEETETTEKAE